MKKFQFGLSGVLRYKQQVLDNLQNEHAQAVQLVHAQERALRRTETRHAGLNAEFRARAAEGMTAADALGLETGLRVLERQMQAEEERLRQLREKAEEKRRQMVAAHQDTASLEKIRERQWEEYQKSARKQEEQLIDELVSNARAAKAAPG